VSFYVLDNPKTQKQEEHGLAITDFISVDPVNTGSAPLCPMCHQPIGMLPWLPPYRAELEFWGSEAGDIAFGSGNELVVSERFRQLYLNAGLVGLSGFDRVEVVRTRSYGRKKRIKPAGDYYVVRIARGRGAIDQRASELVREGGPICEECREGGIGGIVKRVKRIVLEENTWSGEDIFYPRGLSIIMTSERYRDFHMQNKINNGLLVEAPQFSFDYYPWETAKRKNQ